LRQALVDRRAQPDLVEPHQQLTFPDPLAFLDQDRGDRAAVWLWTIWCARWG
jgi:hypothetical protein